ncbi:MAG: hypothetical protein ABIP55_04420 [Tepidisphaeraceae bacterium]
MNSRGGRISGKISGRHVFRSVAGRYVFVLALLLGGSYAISAPATKATVLDKGHRILIERGLQIHAMVFVENPFELKLLKEANFTGVNFGWTSDMKKFGAPSPAPNAIAARASSGGAASAKPQADTPLTWSRWSTGGGAHETSLKPDEQPYAHSMIAWACADEENLNDPAMREKVAAWFAETRPKFPDTILYTNQYGGQVTNENLNAYVEAAKPDMLSFDTYPFLLDAPVGGSPTPFYGDAMRYRKHAIGRGIPYAMWIQTFNGENRYRNPSESEMRLNQFAAWTFGYKMVTAFTYNSGATNLFKGPGDRNPTDALRQIARINRESRNLGPALVRLLNTDVRIIMGERREGEKTVANPQPVDVQPWRFGENDPYLRGVSAENIGKVNDKLRGDVLIGWFRPLQDERHGDETYFMVTNGLCAPPSAPVGGSAAACRQRITLNLHFKDSGITALQRLSRATGKVEEVALKPVANNPGRFLLMLELDGGTGDLFKFQTGAPFVGVDEGAAGKKRH